MRVSYSHLNDLPADIRERAGRVKLAMFDVDGVLTDGKLYYSDDGRESKAFHVHDGFGLKRLMANGIEVAIITARMSHMVTERTAELGIAHVYQGQDNKLACYEQLIHALKLAGALLLLRRRSAGPGYHAARGLVDRANAHMGARAGALAHAIARWRGRGA